MILDDQIIKSVLEGRTQNFEILIDRYKTKIINFVNQMIFDRDEAQNITQDVFLKIYENLSKYKMENSFQAYIFTIAKNLTLNYLNKRKRTVFLSSFFSKRAEEISFQSESTQFKEVEDKVKDDLLIKALRELKEPARLALILKVYLDNSYKQISEITGWSIPKIETLVSRAKKSLREKIYLQENGQKNV